MFCPDCGNDTQASDRFCQRCGKALHTDNLYREPPPRQQGNAMALAIIAHVLGIFVPVLGALIIKLVQDRDDDAFAADQIREALNFQVSAVLIGIGVGIGGVIFSILTLGLGFFLFGLVWWLLGMAYFILCIIGTVKCANGERFRYPFSLRLFN